MSRDIPEGRSSYAPWNEISPGVPQKAGEPTLVSLFDGESVEPMFVIDQASAKFLQRILGVFDRTQDER